MGRDGNSTQQFDSFCNHPLPIISTHVYAGTTVGHRGVVAANRTVVFEGDVVSNKAQVPARKNSGETSAVSPVTVSEEGRRVPWGNNRWPLMSGERAVPVQAVQQRWPARGN